jgi:hypothetical protein
LEMIKIIGFSFGGLFFLEKSFDVDDEWGFV